MKNSFLILCLIIITTVALAQTGAPPLKADLEKYLEAVKQKNNELALEYSHPKSFVYLSKEQMLESMNKSKKDSSITLTIDSSRIISISAIIEVGDAKYAHVKYSIASSMKYLNLLKINLEGDTQEFSPFEFTYSMMKKEPNITDLKYDRQEGIIHWKTTIQCYALFNPEYSNWKLLPDSKNTQPVCEQLIPEKIMKQLKK
jgi:hypothetical protein